jgi:cytochrome c peroxidase
MKNKPIPTDDRRVARSTRVRAVAMALGMAAATGAAADPSAAKYGPGVESYLDPSGILTLVNINGRTDKHGAFFQSLGSNGRTCDTCHKPDQAMSITPRDIQQRFARTRGQDPLFAAVDGANCPDARRSSAADHSLLLQHGLIRVFLPVPANAQFTIQVVHDPYGCAMVPDPNGGPAVVSVYRRPLPTANLGFLSTIMFDGRETKQPLNSEPSFPDALAFDLNSQALDAVLTHAQAASPPSAAQLQDIVEFESGLYTAQAYGYGAGVLAVAGASGGPFNLAREEYYPGINDSLGADPELHPFTATGMTLFSAWTGVGSRRGGFFEQLQDAARRDIAAGEALFNTAPVQITNVRGLNDNAALGSPDTFTGTCTTCHDTPNVGNHSFPLPLDIGTGHTVLAGLETDPAIAAGLAQLSAPDLPVYEIKGCQSPFAKGEPESFFTTDPGKALVTGQCSDFNRVKGPVLRGLAARAPYFHNGAAHDLHQLVSFYDQRFKMNLTARQKEQLVAFLNSL